MELKATFCKPLYRSRPAGFTVGLYRLLSPALLPNGSASRYVKVSGMDLPERKGIAYSFSGHWEKDKKAGNENYFFEAGSFRESLPQDEAGIIRYLKSIDGIGKKMAERIFEAFGEDVFRVLDEEPERLLAVKGVRVKTYDKIRTCWIKSRGGRELFAYLYGFQIPESVIRKLFDTYEEFALEIVKSEPYSLTDFSGISFAAADRIARAEGFGLLCRQRIEAAMEEAVRRTEAAGSTCCLWQELYEGTLDLLKTDLSTKEHALLQKEMERFSEKAPLEAVFFRLMKRQSGRRDPRIVSEKAEGKVFYFRKTTRNREKAVSENLKRIAAAASPSSISRKELDDILEEGVRKGRLTARLSPPQKDAVLTALAENLCIITGVPGTGKTFVQKAILYVWERMKKNARPLLLAPTGRAAKRMEESSGHPARTIHSALGLFEEEGCLRQRERLECDLLIVDETSMLDNATASILFSSVETGTKVILIGDENQLPSVGAGAVLRELLAARVFPSVRLTEVFRQAKGSSISYNAARMQRGETQMLEDDSFSFLEAAGSERIAWQAAAIYAELAETLPLSEIAVLSPYRKKTTTGTALLNKTLQKVIFPERGEERDLQKGDKVMFTKNMSGLTNGEIGTITDVRSGKEGKIIAACFGEDEVLLDEKEMRHLELAYASTIHKSQGSEYKVVLLIMDPAHAYMHTREIVYTALTRAKERCIVIGSRAAFIRAAGNDRKARRTSLLAHFLKTAGDGSREDSEETEEQLKLNI